MEVNTNSNCTVYPSSTLHLNIDCITLFASRNKHFLSNQTYTKNINLKSAVVEGRKDPQPLPYHEVPVVVVVVGIAVDRLVLVVVVRVVAGVEVVLLQKVSLMAVESVDGLSVGHVGGRAVFIIVEAGDWQQRTLTAVSRSRRQ